MANLDSNRIRTHKVIDYFDEVGREGVYSGSYDDCAEFIAEQSDNFCKGMYDIIPNPSYKQ